MTTTGLALLEITGVKKRFGATAALDGVNLSVARGEVHAVIGENGAGKSTLMNILSASLRPDAGSITFRGLRYRPTGPLDARRHGIAHIHQELSLCAHLSVAENIFLGREPRGWFWGWLDRRSLTRATAELIEVFAHPAITPGGRVADLPIAARQIVEICRALAQHPALILMDEPTSSLQQADVTRLFSFIRRLRDSGVSIIYISHFLEEVREIADACTVLRDGKTVLTAPIKEISDQQIITAMVGRSITDLFPPRRPVQTGESVLEVEDLSAPPAVRRAGLTLYRGEVLGIAGLIGAGRSEFLRALFGLENASAKGKVPHGKVTLLGRRMPLKGRPQIRIGRGLGYLSEDRKGEGLALTLSIADNITLTNYSSCARWGWIDLKKQQTQAKHQADLVSVKGGAMEAAVQNLSGGNQQKVALARLLHQGCDVLLLDEPTRGVDVASKVQIHALIVSLARAGKAVVMVSSYLPELFGICDRLAVMRRGTLSAARPIEEWTPVSVLQAAIAPTA